MVLDKEHIREVLASKLEELDAFLVDITVSAGDKIVVFADTRSKGISIGEIESIHRFLNEALDKENNDFHLTVSSPGMEQPLKVAEQYEKCLQKKVSVKLTDGSKLEGTLDSFTPDHLVLAIREKRKVEGSNKKEWVEEKRTLPFEQIKETKKVITFK